jgi:predicted secreted protein
MVFLVTSCVPEVQNTAPTIGLKSPVANMNKEISLGEVSVDVVFEWEGKDQDNDMLSYVLYVKEPGDSSFVKKYQGPEKTKALNFNKVGIYSWKVTVSDGSELVESEERSFEITKESTIEIINSIGFSNYADKPSVVDTDSFSENNVSLNYDIDFSKKIDGMEFVLSVNGNGYSITDNTSEFVLESVEFGASYDVELKAVLNGEIVDSESMSFSVVSKILEDEFFIEKSGNFVDFSEGFVVYKHIDSVWAEIDNYDVDVESKKVYSYVLVEKGTEGNVIRRTDLIEVETNYVPEGEIVLGNNLVVLESETVEVPVEVEFFDNDGDKVDFSLFINNTEIDMTKTSTKLSFDKAGEYVFEMDLTDGTDGYYVGPITLRVLDSSEKFVDFSTNKEVYDFQETVNLIDNSLNTSVEPEWYLNNELVTPVDGVIQTSLVGENTVELVYGEDSVQKTFFMNPDTLSTHTIGNVEVFNNSAVVELNGNLNYENMGLVLNPKIFLDGEIISNISSDQKQINLDNLIAGKSYNLKIEYENILGQKKYIETSFQTVNEEPTLNITFAKDLEAYPENLEIEILVDANDSKDDDNLFISVPSLNISRIDYSTNKRISFNSGYIGDNKIIEIIVEDKNGAKVSKTLSYNVIQNPLRRIVIQEKDYYVVGDEIEISVFAEYPQWNAFGTFNGTDWFNFEYIGQENGLYKYTTNYILKESDQGLSNFKARMEVSDDALNSENIEFRKAAKQWKEIMNKLNSDGQETELSRLSDDKFDIRSDAFTKSQLVSNDSNVLEIDGNRFEFFGVTEDFNASLDISEKNNIKLDIDYTSFDYMKVSLPSIEKEVYLNDGFVFSNFLNGIISFSISSEFVLNNNVIEFVDTGIDLNNNYDLSQLKDLRNYDYFLNYDQMQVESLTNNLKENLSILFSNLLIKDFKPELLDSTSWFDVRGIEDYLILKQRDVDVLNSLNVDFEVLDFSELNILFDNDKIKNYILRVNTQNTEYIGIIKSINSNQIVLHDLLSNSEIFIDVKDELYVNYEAVIDLSVAEIFDVSMHKYEILKDMVVLEGNYLNLPVYNFYGMSYIPIDNDNSLYVDNFGRYYKVTFGGKNYYFYVPREKDVEYPIYYTNEDYTGTRNTHEKIVLKDNIIQKFSQDDLNNISLKNENYLVNDKISISKAEILNRVNTGNQTLYKINGTWTKKSVFADVDIADAITEPVLSNELIDYHWIHLYIESEDILIDGKEFNVDGYYVYKNGRRISFTKNILRDYNLSSDTEYVYTIVPVVGNIVAEDKELVVSKKTLNYLPKVEYISPEDQAEVKSPVKISWIIRDPDSLVANYNELELVIGNDEIVVDLLEEGKTTKTESIEIELDSKLYEKWSIQGIDEKGRPFNGEERAFTVEEEIQNNLPVVEANITKTVDENTELTFDLNEFVLDEDEDILSYNLIDREGVLTRNGVYTWKPSFGKAGEHTVKFAVTDGVDSVEGEFIVTVNKVNRLPKVTIISPENNALINSTSVDILFRATDADNNSLSYELNYQKGTEEVSQISLNSNSYELKNLSYSSEYTWWIKVSDGTDEVISSKRVFSVSEAPNNPPEFDVSKTDVFELKENERFEIELSNIFLDDDGDALKFRKISGPGSIGQAGVYTYTPSYNEAGTKYLVVEVSDGEETLEKTFEFNIENTNRKPNILAMVPGNDSNDISINPVLKWLANDRDGDELTYTVFYKTIAAEDFNKTQTNNNNLNLNNLAYSTEYQWYLQVSDGTETIDSDFFLFKTIAEPNEAPVWTSDNLIFNIDEGSSKNIDLSSYISDPNEDSIFIEIKDNDYGWFSSNNSSLIIDNVPYDLVSKAEQTKQIIVELTATDKFNVSSKQITLNIKNVNAAPNKPELILPSDDSDSGYKTDGKVSVDLDWKANDIDGDELNFEVYYKKSEDTNFSSVSASNSEITLAQLEYSTTYEWYVVANDGQKDSEQSETWSFTTVSEESSNEPPVWSSDDLIINVKEGQSTDFNLTEYVTQEDSDELIYGVIDEVFKNISVTNEGNLRVTPNYDVVPNEMTSETFDVVVYVRDNLVSVKKTVSVVVENVNQKPSVAFISPITDIVDSNNILVSWEGSDLDGDLLSYSLKVNGITKYEGTNNKYNITPDSSTLSLEIAVDDGKEFVSVSKNVTISKPDGLIFNTNALIFEETSKVINTSILTGSNSKLEKVYGYDITLRFNKNLVDISNIVLNVDGDMSFITSDNDSITIAVVSDLPINITNQNFLSFDVKALSGNTKIEIEKFVVLDENFTEIPVVNNSNELNIIQSEGGDF